MPHLLSKGSGPLLVAFAACLWATDALVRYSAVNQVDPTEIVWIEHLLAVVLLFPWVMMKCKTTLFTLSLREWFAAAFSGVFGSALATVFYTASFRYINPSIAVLLQKLQPVIVVLLAYVFLGEKPSRKFYFWGAVALVAGTVISFPDLRLGSLFRQMNLESTGILYSLGAVIFWAASTVSGKILLRRTPAEVATFWRFSFGMVALGAIIFFAHMPFQWGHVMAKPVLLPLLYLSLIPGILAMLVYYKGLTQTPASVTTFIELVYPIGAIALNYFFLNTRLQPIQTGAGAALLFAVTMISF